MPLKSKQVTVSELTCEQLITRILVDEEHFQATPLKKIVATRTKEEDLEGLTNVLDRLGFDVAAAGEQVDCPLLPRSPLQLAQTYECIICPNLSPCNALEYVFVQFAVLSDLGEHELRNIHMPS
jgi:hypothetical protein